MQKRHLSDPPANSFSPPHRAAWISRFS